MQVTVQTEHILVDGSQGGFKFSVGLLVFRIDIIVLIVDHQASSQRRDSFPLLFETGCLGFASSLFLGLHIDLESVTDLGEFVRLVLQVPYHYVFLLPLKQVVMQQHLLFRTVDIGLDVVQSLNDASEESLRNHLESDRKWGNQHVQVLLYKEDLILEVRTLIWVFGCLLLGLNKSFPAVLEQVCN